MRHTWQDAGAVAFDFGDEPFIKFLRMHKGIYWLPGRLSSRKENP
jgi:hypothetical protein